eukprot:3382126-Amphidinium_carterae.1
MPEMVDLLTPEEKASLQYGTHCCQCNKQLTHNGSVVGTQQFELLKPRVFVRKCSRLTTMLTTTRVALCVGLFYVGGNDTGTKGVIGVKAQPGP